MANFQTGSALGGAVWSKQGTQGNQWYAAQVNIPAQSQQFNLVFEGIAGPGFQGDIALDDIRVKNNGCPSNSSKFKKVTCILKWLIGYINSLD